MAQSLYILVTLAFILHLASSEGLTTYIVNEGINQTAVDYYVNRCLRGLNHKDVPGPERDLHDQCQPWSNRACCSASTTLQFHNNPTWYNFDWNHCERDISQKCRQWMIQDLCFYECSPNQGPWLVPQKKKIRDERFLGVPLCKSECDIWFNDCKDDLTCSDDWSTGWNWTTGTNVCPEGSSCSTFKDKFKTAQGFCEGLWGGSFKVVDDDTERCMYLWFNDPEHNPNDEVALAKAIELVNSGGLSSARRHLWMVSLVLMTLSVLLVR